MNKFLTIFAAAALLVSCSSEEPTGVAGDGNSLRVSVQDRGFAGSRATEENLATVFTVGDKIGLYAVKDGAIVSGLDNVCIQAVESADGVAWELTGNVTLEEVDGIAYYAYYPYVENLGGTVNASANSAADFFADVVSHWTVKEDQSEYADYTASDLMTAKGVVADGGLSFAMEHRMSLIRINFPSYKYVFTNTPAIPDYVLGQSEDVKFATGSPYVAEDGEYRFIVNPSAEAIKLSGSYTWTGQRFAWESTPAVSAGTVKTINIDSDRNEVIEHNLQIGDFLLSDGNLLSKDAPAGDVQALDVVGIVYNIDPERIGDAEKEALGGVAHGSVMAVKDAYYPYPLCYWSTKENDETEIGLKNTVGSKNTETAKLFESDKSGYETLSIVKEKRSDDYANSVYEVFILGELHCGDTKNIQLLNARTTGWYTPAVGQWLDIVRNLGKGACPPEQALGGSDLVYWKNQGNVLSNINSYMENIAESNRNLLNTSRWYWTTSFSSPKYAYYVQVTDGVQGLNSFSCFANSKTTSLTYLRPVLTF